MSKEINEALECLERIDNTLCLNNIKGKLEFGIDTEEHTDCDSVIGMTEDIETIKQALTQKSKKELAFDVIKGFDLMHVHFAIQCKKYDIYLEAIKYAKENHFLSEEQYNLLKEVL